ncbi:MAG: stage III sporulation protein AE [Lachnospiraceae bacterium]|nr:stage III sporulation protein AE [Lachnospiraceae bacterium]
MDMDMLWEEYRLEDFQQGIQSLFPESRISLEVLLDYIWEGNLPETLGYLAQGLWNQWVAQLVGARNIFVWLLILGIVSAILGFFVQIFDKHQVADISFYLTYLLLTIMLFQSFMQIGQVSRETVEQIILFVKLLLPTYMIAVGVSTGAATVGAFSAFLMIIIFLVEKLLLALVLPLIQSYFLLVMVNGIWMEEKLNLLISLLKKVLGFLLKSAMGIVTGLGIFQAVITPAVDNVKNSVLEKAVSALPGVGNATRSIVEVLLGSAAVIKNGLGVVLVVLLFALCAIPLLKILLTMAAVKGAAAFMGIISDKRLTACVNKAGDAFSLTLQLTATAMFLFVIVITILAMANGNYG